MERMNRAFECIPDEKSFRALWNVYMLCVSISFPAFTIRNVDLDEDCTLLPLPVFLTEGLKLWLSSEYPDALDESMPCRLNP